MMPRAGGEYVYLREAYHPAVGAMSGWISLTAGFSAAIAVSALGFATYLHRVIPGLEPGAATKLVAIGLVLAMTGLHAFDTVIGGRIQAGFTVAKVVCTWLCIAAEWSASLPSARYSPLSRLRM